MDDDDDNATGHVKSRAERQADKAAKEASDPNGDVSAGGREPKAALLGTKAQKLAAAQNTVTSRPISEVADFSKCKKLKGGKGKRAAPADVAKTRGDRKHTPAQLRKLAGKRDKAKEEKTKQKGPTLKQAQARHKDHRMNYLLDTDGFLGHTHL